MAYVQNELKFVRRPCVKYLREQIALKQLKRFEVVYWTCPPDFGKQTMVNAGRLKVDGYEKGVFDLTIIGVNKWVSRVFLVEFKYGKNKYTPEQQAIADSLEGLSATALKIYSIDEFIEFITKEFK